MTTADRPVRVLTIGNAPSGPDSRGGIASVVTLMSEHPDPSVRVRVVPTYVDGRGLRPRLLGVRGMVLASLLVLLRRVDVIHVHLSHGGSVVRKSVPLTAARLARVPAVVHAHSYDFAGWFDRLPAWGRRVVRHVLRADRWVVLGDAHVDEFASRLRYPRERFLVLHNPAVLPDRALSAVAPTGDEPVVAVGIGRLGRRKGSYDVVAAVAKLPDAARARLRVVLAGDGSNDKVRRAIVEADVEGTVEVLGWLGPAERDALLARAHVLVLPSYDEGLPMALLESMAAGLAPVVSPVGGIPDVITNGVDGLLVEPGDVGAISDALKRLVEDPVLLAGVRAAARDRVEQFGVQPWYGDLTALWRTLARD